MGDRADVETLGNAAKLMPISIAVDGLRLGAYVDVTAAPRTCERLLQFLPWQAQFVGARWSGPICLVQKINLYGLPLESPIALLSPGDIVFHPEHRDLAIAYGPSQFVEQTRAVYVTHVGRIIEGLSEFAAIGSRIHKTGAETCIWSKA